MVSGVTMVPLRGLLDSMKRLRPHWPQRGWSWDARLACVTSSFSTEVEAQVRQTARMLMPNEWTAIELVPTSLRAIAHRAGGLRSGQRLLASSTGAPLFAYGLWWPWGDGMTVSLRIGIGGDDATDAVERQICEPFGVEL